MLFEPCNAQHLKPWLVKTLEPICDAEPGALAEYILALLKHNVTENEMRKELVSQLDEFLEKECGPFIDTLFNVLRSKSYLPYMTDSTPSMSSEGGIPIPLDGLISPAVPTSPRIRKRSIDDDGARPPTKGPRFSEEANFARFGNGRGMQDARGMGGWSNGHDYAMNGMGRGNGSTYMSNSRRAHGYQPPETKRGICRDYHNNGYCSRGALCKFSHGEDAVIPGQMFPMNSMGAPFMPMFGQGFGMPGGPPTAYDPHEARMDMRGRPQMRPALMPRGADGQARQTSGELPVIQDLTPNVPHNDVQPNPLPLNEHPMVPTSIPMPDASGYSQTQPFDGDIDMAPPEKRQSFPHGRGSRGGSGGGRGRGTFGDIPGMRPERRRDKTLVVEKIPADKLSLEHVNNWFKRFGTVTNVAIDKPHAKSLISFAEHEEAHAAWKSEDAVFGNRFVKVFWHRPMEGHGQKGTKLLAASAPVVASIASPATPTFRPSPAPPTTPKKAAFGSLAAKQKELEERITEQKGLMTSLVTATGEEKKTIMTRLKELTSISTSITARATSERPSEPDQKKKDLLDKELDLHATASGEAGEGGESAEELKIKLERLKAEAASLGIPDGESASTYGSRGGYRGRARGGRGGWRGAMRGGPPRASMKLDNRPKQLLIQGASGSDIEALREWYEPGGQVDSVTKNTEGGIIVSFKNRAAAEQGLSKGTTIPNISNVQIGWHAGSTAQAPKSASIPSSEPPVSSKAAVNAVNSKPTISDNIDMEESRPNEEESEALATGWGGDKEDGMGMF